MAHKKNSGLIVWQLKKYFKSHYSDIYDLLDIHYLIDRTLSYQENFNILKTGYDLLADKDFNLKFNDVKLQLELLYNSKNIELFNILEQSLTEANEILSICRKYV